MEIKSLQSLKTFAAMVAVTAAVGYTSASQAFCVDGGSNCPKCQLIRFNGAGATITPGYKRAGAFLGTNSAEIQAKFASIQESNFAKGDAKLIISRLSDKELNDIAVLYNSSPQAANGTLLRTLATRLDGASLTKVAKAFGKLDTQRAVMAYSSANVQQEFIAQVGTTIGVPSVASTQLSSATIPKGFSPMGAPNTDMSLPEIYLDFRTAPVGSLGAASALSETLIYAGTRLSPAVAVGTTIGSVIHELIETYDPDLDDVIGGTIQAAADNMSEAGTELQQGQMEQAGDALFGTPVGKSGDYDGDWNVGESYEFFEGGGTGGC